MINYTYEFRIYPNKEQQVLLEKHFGSCRFLYNFFLNKRKTFYLENSEKIKLKQVKPLNYYDNAKELTNLKTELYWLKECNSQALQSAVSNLEQAYQNFFAKRSSFPKFKNKHGKQSFTCPQNFSIENNKLFIPKFREGIKIKLHRKIIGEIGHLVIKKTPTNKYFVSVCVGKEKPFKETIGEIKGFDLGIKDLLISSEGEKYENKNFYRKSEKKIGKLQKQLSKKQKGGKNRNKIKLKLAKVHEKVANQRKNYLHKISSSLINENQVLIFEDLNVKGMVKNHKLAKSISDCSWSELKRQIKYKANWYNREIIEIDRFFPSSKTCYSCNYINQSLTLNDRTWKCPDCGSVHDRDINAARMILKQGLNIKNIGQELPKLKPVENKTSVKVSRKRNQKQVISEKQEAQAFRLG